MSDIINTGHTVAIIGGGAAGLFAAYGAAKKGNSVTIFEKNEKLGKKIYITGKGRCNLTNNVSVDEFLQNVCVNPKFLYSALNFLSPSDVMNFFENNRCPLKTERGNRVFPVSDKASDITNTLSKILLELGVRINYLSDVSSIVLSGNSPSKCVGISCNGKFLPFDSVIVCTGGASYPLTGSTGDGYKFALSCGHTVVPPKPSLVGLELLGNDFFPLQGLTLKNVAISVYNSEKQIYSDFGEMLFTHFGVSGPIVLSASCVLNRNFNRDIILKIDLKPALDEKTLDTRIVREFSSSFGKSLSTVMRSLLPRSLIDLVLSRAGIHGGVSPSEITKEKREDLVKTLKNLTFKVKGLRPIEEAIVTAGGVSVKEINPKTMESKLVSGLFFAGETLDVDAFTGGFNLQIAFSTGYLAGCNS